MQHSSFKMHKYVWMWVAIFTAFAASFPVAMARVSHSAKFAGQPLNSWTCKDQIPTQRTVTHFATCAQLKATLNAGGTGTQNPVH